MVTHNQYDQIGQFLKAIGHKFLTKVAQIIGAILKQQPPF